MKKVVYVMGSIEVLFGALLLSITSIIKESMPLLGRIAFQAAMKGGYSPNEYAVSFPLVTAIAIALIALGIVQIVIFAFKKDRD